MTALAIPQAVQDQVCQADSTLALPEAVKLVLCCFRSCWCKSRVQKVGGGPGIHRHQIYRVGGLRGIKP